MTILTEALDRYEVDGLFFNMFGNPDGRLQRRADGAVPRATRASAGSARATAATCRRTADADYRAFMADSAREVAAAIADLIHAKRPQAAFLTYIEDHTDGIMSESNTAVGRPLPLWPYSASDNVSRALGSEPDKMAINLSMSFVDFPVALRERAAPGDAAAALPEHGARRAAGGRRRRDDGPGRIAPRSRRPGPSSQWHAQHEDLYVGQKNAARVLLLATGDTAGVPRLLPPPQRAAHPVRGVRNLRWLDGGSRPLRSRDRAGRAPRGDRRATSAAAAGCWSRARRHRPLPIGRVVGTPQTQGYWRIHDRSRLPSLRDTNLLFIDGDYLELAPVERPILTLIPTAMFGPPEKVWCDKTETTMPGLVVAPITARAARPTCRGTSAGSTTATVHRPRRRS